MEKSKLAALLATLILLPATGWASQERWYTDQQVATGEKLYAINCANCHGEKGEATENWRQTNEQGKYPPPPLNGTAHTWHHSLDVLRRTVREGGGKIGGSMPAFANVLNPNSIDEVLAYVQSLWPEEIYSTWAKANPVDSAAAGAGQPTESAAGQPTRYLSKLLPPGTQVGAPEETPLAGIYEINANGRIVYVDSSGQFAMTGDLINLATGENLTENKRALDRVRKVSRFPGDDKVIFAAEGEERAYIDVFTDTTCPYCRKLHAEVPQLQAAGVTVRYLPFPRGGRGSQGDRELRAIWCDEDPVMSMHLAKMQSGIPDNNGSCAAASAVDAGYRLGIDVGVRGTPAIMLPDGTMIQGYRPHGDLVSALGVAGN